MKSIPGTGSLAYVCRRCSSSPLSTLGAARPGRCSKPAARNAHRRCLAARGSRSRCLARRLGRRGGPLSGRSRGRLRVLAEFRPVLRLRLGHGLPLHLAWRVLPALGQRDDVIDHVAGTTVRISGLPLELFLRGTATLNMSVLVARDAGIGLRMCDGALGQRLLKPRQQGQRRKRRDDASHRMLQDRKAC
jgi:hypothetical protein